MHPEAFSIGPLHIRWYGIMAALGFVACMLVMRANRKRAGLDSDQVSDIMIFGMIGAVAGARLFYVVQFWRQFKNNWAEIPRIDHGGLVFYGGFIMAIFTISAYCRWKKIAVLKVFDILTPGLAFGHALGRVGCLLNGCCYGRVCRHVPGVVYPAGSPPAAPDKYPDLAKTVELVNRHIDSKTGQEVVETVIAHPSLPLHAVQLYEFAANIAIGCFLLWLMRFKRLKSGQIAAVYLMLYSLMRFSDEFFRGDHDDFFFGAFTPAQMIGAIAFPLGIALFFLWGSLERNDHGEPRAEG